MFEAIGAIFLVLAGIAYYILSAIVITAFYLFFTPYGWIILITLFVLSLFVPERKNKKNK
ncbi:hypothetical protein YJ57_20285 [Salmonella enterica subsp. enterica]|nr:hypothetical protein [Salmonella enterica subsp. enterica]